MLKEISIGLISTVALTFPALADHHKHEAEIASAMSAAPAEISAEATIMSPDDVVIRKGSNGWTCYPKVINEAMGEDGEDDIDEAGCYNEVWMAFSTAFKIDKTAVASEGGMAYMISAKHPHTMILMPGKDAVSGYPTERGKGTWAMAVGTPWQHLMIPYKE